MDIKLEKLTENELTCVVLSKQSERVYFNLQRFNQDTILVSDNVQMLDTAAEMFLVMRAMLLDGFKVVEKFSTSFFKR